MHRVQPEAVPKRCQALSLRSPRGNEHKTSRQHHPFPLHLYAASQQELSTESLLDTNQLTLTVSVETKDEKLTIGGVIEAV